MKPIFFTLSLVAFTIMSAVAQKSSLVFFTEEGEKFYVVLNGVRQNDKPSANVTVSNLHLPNYKAKIIFENSALGSVDNNVYLQDADGNHVEVVYLVRKDKKGKYVMRINGFTEVASSPTNQKSDVVVYHAEETPTAAPIETVKQTTTTTTTTKPTNTNTQQETVNMNFGGLGIGMNVNTNLEEDNDGNVNMNLNMGGINTNSSVRQTTTTTTTTTTRTNTNPAVGQPVPTTPVAAPAPAPVRSAGCISAVSSADLASGKKSITSSSFSDTQMKTAKIFTKNNCLSVAQIKEIVGIFSFEASKIEYAKYAYDYCVDKKNYYQLNDAFSFSSSSDELNVFLESK